MNREPPYLPFHFNPSRLRMAIALRGLSRESLAAVSGIDVDWIRLLTLRGEFPEPRNEVVQKLADATKFPVGFFYNGDDDNTLSDELDPAGISFRAPAAGPWEILCDRCDTVVAKGSTEAKAYERAEKAGMLRNVKMSSYEQWDLCPRCATETGKSAQRGLF
jgi:transcriptional regulator with XRE-family HTH domain